MASGSPLPIETYLKEWENFCLNFYINDDKLAGTIVGLVEFASHSNEEVTVNFSNVDQDIVGKEEDLEGILNQIGFVGGTMLLPKEFNKYLDVTYPKRTVYLSTSAVSFIVRNEIYLHYKDFYYKFI